MINDLLVFVSAFSLLLLSTIGYGILFQNLCFGLIKDFKDEKAIYTGFYGLFFITLISLITNLLFPHTIVHNLILHIIGITCFFYFDIKNKKNFVKIIFLISAATFFALLISKTHDDFSYYHLPFTKYLTENKIIFGMGNINHGYNLLSSLFFLNSTFYLPLINYFSFHFGIIFFLVFFNFFIIKEIFNSKNHEIIKFLYILAFSFFNLSFNRIAEYGTDKPGQLLITILVIKLFQILCFDKEKIKINKIIILLPLLAYSISLKTYFLSYLILGLAIVNINSKYLKNIKEIIYSKSFIFFLLTLLIYFFHHFISTGCIISPLASTCFENQINWARKDMLSLSIWVEQWSKAGAGPNFRIENVNEYLQNFNWVSNWIEKYFMLKMLDQLVILFFSFFVIFLLFKNFNKKKVDILKLNKKIVIFYILIFIIFLIWFSKHPTLRYGGYSIVFLTIAIPFSLFLHRFQNRNYFNKKLKILILLVVIVFNFKNITRIENEIERGDHYKFSNFPFFALKEKEYEVYQYQSGLNIYSAHHCWASPTPCGQVNEKFNVKKHMGYYFINKER